MIGAAQIGQAGPNMEAVAKSKGAAYEVYAIINKVILNCHLVIFCLASFDFLTL